MTVGTLAQEVAKLTTADEVGINDFGARDRLILQVAQTYVDAGDAASTGLANGKIDIGDSNGVAQERTVSGVITLSNAGVSAFAAATAFKGSTDSNGEIAITGMTAAGCVVLTANESQAAVHVVPGSAKITVYAAATTNVVASKSFGVLVVTKA